MVLTAELLTHRLLLLLLLLLLLPLPMALPPKLQFISMSTPCWWMAAPVLDGSESLVVVAPSRPLPTKTESWTTTADVRAGLPLVGVAGPSTHSAPPSVCIASRCVYDEITSMLSVVNEHIY